YQAYFTDEGGTPLSVAEVREHLRQDVPLHVNHDADYNGQPVNADDYLHYLSRNLYRFSCSLHSSFGNYWMFHLPDGVTRTYFHLDPKHQAQDGLGGDASVNYFTSNPDYFWKTP
ncbi:MAG: transglutaminase domain-containing protein, partial [Gemmatimonadales bacterium]|nr:transglutaminase domain-containing protein [Gemmatimonadales bacterium]